MLVECLLCGLFISLKVISINIGWQKKKRLMYIVFSYIVHGILRAYKKRKKGAKPDTGL